MHDNDDFVKIDVKMFGLLFSMLNISPIDTNNRKWAQVTIAQRKFMWTLIGDYCLFAICS